MLIPVGEHGQQTYLQIDRICEDNHIGTHNYAHYHESLYNGDTLTRPPPGQQAWAPHLVHSPTNGNGTSGKLHTNDVDLRCFRIQEKAAVAFVPLIPNPAHCSNKEWQKRESVERSEDGF